MPLLLPAAGNASEVATVLVSAKICNQVSLAALVQNLSNSNSQVV
jgi:hypothetical protein